MEKAEKSQRFQKFNPQQPAGMGSIPHPESGLDGWHGACPRPFQHHPEGTMTRADVTEKILSAKRLKGLTWEEIAAKVGGASRIVVTAACLGQMRMNPEQAAKAAELFGLGREETLLLQEVPYRGSLPQLPPTDPLIYRFYELVMVYGTTWKELIQEEFGDGIMSAIDFDMSLERQPDQKGDRVKLGMSGKFLAYKSY